MDSKKEGPCYVYWVHSTDLYHIESQGYVGITKDVPRRKREHERSARFPVDFIMEIVYEGSREDCFSRETELRPQKGIGWNSAPGGERGDNIGYIQKEEAKKRISNALKGHSVSQEVRQKIREKLKGRKIFCRKSSKGHPGVHAPLRNKKWYNNCVQEAPYQEGEQPEGWSRGRIYGGAGRRKVDDKILQCGQTNSRLE